MLVRAQSPRLGRSHQADGIATLLMRFPSGMPFLVLRPLFQFFQPSGKQLSEDFIFIVLCRCVQAFLKVTDILRGHPIGPSLFFGLFWHCSSPSFVMGARGLRDRLSCLSSGAEPRLGDSPPVRRRKSEPDCSLHPSVRLQLNWPFRPSRGTSYASEGLYRGCIGIPAGDFARQVDAHARHKPHALRLPHS